MKELKMNKNLKEKNENDRYKPRESISLITGMVPIISINPPNSSENNKNDKNSSEIESNYYSNSSRHEIKNSENKSLDGEMGLLSIDHQNIKKNGFVLNPPRKFLKASRILENDEFNNTKLKKLRRIVRIKILKIFEFFRILKNQFELDERRLKIRYFFLYKDRSTNFNSFYNNLKKDDEARKKKDKEIMDRIEVATNWRQKSKKKRCSGLRKLFSFKSESKPNYDYKSNINR